MTMPLDRFISASFIKSECLVASPDVKGFSRYQGERIGQFQRIWMLVRKKFSACDIAGQILRDFSDPHIRETFRFLFISLSQTSASGPDLHLNLLPQKIVLAGTCDPFIQTSRKYTILKLCHLIEQARLSRFSDEKNLKALNQEDLDLSKAKY
jgi:hypothetical protein